jgi:hypothetical protein
MPLDSYSYPSEDVTVKNPEPISRVESWWREITEERDKRAAALKEARLRYETAEIAYVEVSRLLEAFATVRNEKEDR